MDVVVAIFADDKHIATPHFALFGGLSHVGEEFVDIAAAIGFRDKGYSADSQVEKGVGVDGRCRFAHHSEEVVGAVRVDSVVAGITLPCDEQLGLAVGVCELTIVVGAATHQQQVAKFHRVALIKHFADATISHSSRYTARKFVEDILLTKHCHVHIVVSAVEICNAFGLLIESIGGDDKHRGGS